jgi:hypothetical protein
MDLTLKRLKIALLHFALRWNGDAVIYNVAFKGCSVVVDSPDHFIADCLFSSLDSQPPTEWSALTVIPQPTTSVDIYADR